MKFTIPLFMAIIIAMLFGEALAHGPRTVITNWCPWTVYVWSVSKDVNPPSHVPNAALEQGQEFKEDWYTPSAGCLSYKMANIPHLDYPVPHGAQVPISQFEPCNTPPQWYYDFSNVDCMRWGAHTCPFAYHGVLIKNSRPECPTARCNVGDLNCVGAYLHPTDDEKTKGCDISTGDAIVVLCDEFAP